MFDASLGAAAAGVIWARWFATFGAFFGVVGFLVPFAIGIAFGYAFGYRERNVAFPMSIATPIAAFATGLLLSTLPLFVLLAAKGKIGH